MEEHVNVAFAAINESATDEPATVREAKESPKWDSWRQAMDNKIKQLNELKTYKLVTCPPD